jgi:GT2 family glycosyltransferase
LAARRYASGAGSAKIAAVTTADPLLTYCIVNTEKRDLLARCLDAVGREREAVPFATEVLVLDNASSDGSRELAQRHRAVDRVLPLERRIGKASCDTMLLKEAKGEFCLLLNEDAELLPGATAALLAALAADPQAATAGAQLLDPSGRPVPCAWRFPTPRTALLAAVGLADRCVVQSKGEAVRRVDWCQSSALLVRKAAAAAVGYLDERFFVYSDEVDLAKRLADAGYHNLYVPSAQAIHHEQLTADANATARIVELSRNRDLYVRLHHGPLSALAVRLASAFGYLLRAVAAPFLPGRSPRRYLIHVRASLFPGWGEGIREAAERYNRTLRTG